MYFPRHQLDFSLPFSQEDSSSWTPFVFWVWTLLGRRIVAFRCFQSSQLNSFLFRNYLVLHRSTVLFGLRVIFLSKAFASALLLPRFGAHVFSPPPCPIRVRHVESFFFFLSMQGQSALFVPFPLPRFLALLIFMSYDEKPPRRGLVLQVHCLFFPFAFSWFNWVRFFPPPLVSTSFFFSPEKPLFVPIDFLTYGSTLSKFSL